MTRVARGAAIVALLLLAGALAARGAEWYRTTDFFCIYQGSRALLVGRDPYDDAWIRSQTGGLYPQAAFAGGGLAPAPCRSAYGYPLWTAAALVPVAALPLEVAAALWAAAGIGATIYGASFAWRAFRGPARLAWLYAILIVASQPFWILLISGQLDGVVFFVVALLVWALAARRAAGAGAALALTALKPQLVALTLPAVALRALALRERRLLGAVLATGAAMVVVPMAFVPLWPIEWIDELTGRRARVSGLLPTAWGLAADVLGNGWLGAALALGLLAAVWLLVRGRALDLTEVAVLSLPLSLFVTPYAWSYDHLVLAVPWAFLLARAPARGGARLAALVGVVALASALPWALYAVAFARGGETLSAVVPALTAIAVAVALRASRAPTA